MRDVAVKLSNKALKVVEKKRRKVRKGLIKKISNPDLAKKANKLI